MPFTQSFDVVAASFQSVWLDFFSALPRIIGAIIVFAAGWAIALAVGKIVANIVASFKLDEGLARTGLPKSLESAGIRLDSAAFIGGLIRWLFVIVFLLTAANLLQLDGVAAFLQEILLYVPNLVVATVIIVAVLLLAGFFQKLVHASMEAAHLKGGAALGSLVKWAVIIFGFLAAIQQIGVAADIINIVVTGLVAMVALAGGIAFGIAGKDVAAEILQKAKKYIATEK